MAVPDLYSEQEIFPESTCTHLGIRLNCPHDSQRDSITLHPQILLWTGLNSCVLITKIQGGEKKNKKKIKIISLP